MKLRPAKAGTVILVGVVAAALVATAFVRRAMSDESDRARNERILASLKPPPGARIQLKRSEPAVESIDDVRERRIGYATNVEYVVPVGTSPRRVAKHYARELPGWKRHEEVIPCEQVDAGDVPNPCADIIIEVFKKGNAEVSLNLDSFDGGPPWGYELAILQRDR